MIPLAPAGQDMLLYAPSRHDTASNLQATTIWRDRGAIIPQYWPVRLFHYLYALQDMERDSGTCRK